MRNPFKKKAAAPAPETVSKDELERVQRRMGEELRSIIGDYERKLHDEQAKVLELGKVLDTAMETLQQGRRIQLESNGFGYVGVGDEFDTYRLVKLDDIENVENAWHRFLRSHGRDPEALRLCEQCGEAPGTDRSHGPLLCARCSASSDGPVDG